ncbi:uncharacterized protein Z519_02178 [Cladophialophora bantiana CBS 173.52]|uniref:3-hydroxybutyrate dehydrogenase n=1 Tax=Cladophialophora bantiana (strain ATCC 10958 / CBS 173.52 / CDC B-1940 / NIH 8579) TaxID=1442370 RepID=A0A0D2GEG8_CLAB1|nr:uncharacterized protein Z519_02178 [Cladophialophora bantiana CBS 173.52]KIW96787.1 hypothetical protein Z519_02178 [Cladophialophora bantiana CBS 173.52]
MSVIRLKGASAIVTGAGSGISFEYTKLLYAQGCSVLIADIGLRPEAEAFVKSAATDDQEAKVIFHRTDVTDWVQLEIIFDIAEKEFGKSPDIICAGAGIYEPPSLGFWADKDPASHYKILDIDLLHPIKITRIAIRQMLKAARKGTILHISSVACETASLVTPLYSVAKHGVVAFVRGQAGLDDLYGIRVVCIAPGSIKTPLMLSDPQVRHWLDPEKDYMLEPSVLAGAMYAVTVNKNNRYPAGTILEVTDDEEEKWRPIPLYNNPGPQGRATGASKKDLAINEIKGILASEAGSS